MVVEEFQNSHSKLLGFVLFICDKEEEDDHDLLDCIWSTFHNVHVHKPKMHVSLLLSLIVQWCLTQLSLYTWSSWFAC